MRLKIRAHSLPPVISVHRVARHVMAWLVFLGARQHVKCWWAFVLVPLHRGVLALVAVACFHDSSAPNMSQHFLHIQYPRTAGAPQCSHFMMFAPA